jgi:hypothetical protein
MHLHYLAYGSNLHPARLGARVPSAQLVGVAELPGRTLVFHKRSIDGSAKCTVAPGRASQRVHGAVFRLEAAEKALLDRAEGLGLGYDEEWERLSVGSRSTRVFYYVASPEYLDPDLRPYHWYRNLVLAGARHHRFPAEYIAAIEAIESADDPDSDRCVQNEALLRECKAWS